MTAPVTCVYRQLARADVSRLRDLLRVFGDAFGEVDTYQHAVTNDDYLSRLPDKPHFIAIVAMTGDEVVGGLAAYELDKFEQDRREIYIYDLAVAEAHRRRGIARSLIGMLKPLAKQRGATVIFVQADYGDDPAIRLYESLGKREEVLHFDIAVD
jgi:aminoglycoside 3-N-acetyltransferase I